MLNEQLSIHWNDGNIQQLPDVSQPLFDQFIWKEGANDVAYENYKRTNNMVELSDINSESTNEFELVVECLGRERVLKFTCTYDSDKDPSFNATEYFAKIKQLSAIRLKENIRKQVQDAIGLPGEYLVMIELMPDCQAKTYLSYNLNRLLKQTNDTSLITTSLLGWIEHDIWGINPYLSIESDDKGTSFTSPSGKNVTLVAPKICTCNSRTVTEDFDKIIHDDNCPMATLDTPSVEYDDNGNIKNGHHRVAVAATIDLDNLHKQPRPVWNGKDCLQGCNCYEINVYDNNCKDFKDMQCHKPMDMDEQINPGSTESSTIYQADGLYIQIDIQVEQPIGEVFCINNKGDILAGTCSKYYGNKWKCESEESFMYDVTHWLKKVD